MAGSFLLSNEKKLIHIPLYYKIKKNKYGGSLIQVLNSQTAKEEIEKGEIETLVLNTKWMPQTWQINNQIYTSSQSYNNTSGQNEFDIQKYQDNLFKTCIVEWDITDETGNPVPVTPSALDQLPVQVARELIKLYDQITSFGEEDAKK